MRLTSKKIRTKNQAIQLLNDLFNQLEETKPFVGTKDLAFFQLAQNNLIAMRNSINHSEDFFETFFKNKTKKEIQEWVEDEAKKW